MSTTSGTSFLLEPDTNGQASLIVVTQIVYENFTFVVHMVLAPIICIMGLTGNGFGLCVLRKDAGKNQKTIYTYLLSLLMIDGSYLFLGTLVTVMNIMKHFDYYFGNYVIKNMSLYVGYIDITLNHVSSVVLIIMSLERLMAIVSPYTVKNSAITKHPRFIVTVAFLASAVYVLPFAVCFQVKPFINKENKTDYITTLKPETVQFFDKFHLVETIVLHFIAPVIVLVLNILLVLAFSRFQKQRPSIKTGKPNENQIKLNLIVVCIAGLYIILSLPNLFIQTLMIVNDDYSFFGRFRLTFFVFIYTGDLLAQINAASDVFVYILVSVYYRSVFKAMLCSCCFSKNECESSNEPKDSTSKTKKTDVKPYP